MLWSWCFNIVVETIKLIPDNFVTFQSSFLPLAPHMPLGKQTSVLLYYKWVWPSVEYHILCTDLWLALYFSASCCHYYVLSNSSCFLRLKFHSNFVLHKTFHNISSFTCKHVFLNLTIMNFWQLKKLSCQLKCNSLGEHKFYFLLVIFCEHLVYAGLFLLPMFDISTWFSDCTHEHISLLINVHIHS